MASLGDLYNMRSNCKRQLSDQKSKLKKYEDAYDSLALFKDTVANSHGAFDSANTSKTALLRQLESLAPTCRSAKEYADGSDQLFSNIGNFIVDKAFDGLEGSAALTLGTYKIKISNTESRIEELENQIRYLNTLIASAQEEGDE